MSFQPEDIQIAAFNIEQATTYYDALNEFGLQYNYGGVPLQYGPGVIASNKVVQELLECSGDITRHIEITASNIHEIKDKIGGGNSMMFMDRPIYHRKIANQLVELARIGYQLPFTYDVLLVKDGENDFKLKTVELQTATSYTHWFQKIVQSVITANPDFTQYISKVGDPEGDIARLRETLGEILVFDIDPLTGPTAGDKINMAIALGYPFPVDPINIFVRDKRLYVKMYNLQDQYVDSIELKNVFCRMLPNDIKSLENRLHKAGDPDLNDAVFKFLTDYKQVQWVMHPTWSQIINKSELNYLKYYPIAKMHSTDIYIPGQDVVPDFIKLYVKPENGNSGTDQYVIDQTLNTQIPNGYIGQEYLELKPFFVDTEIGTFEVIVELRHMPPATIITAADQQRGSYLMARVAQARRLNGSQTKTNLGEIQAALYEFLDKNGIPRDKHSIAPVGLCPIFVN